MRPIPPEDPRLAWPTLILSDAERYDIGAGMVQGAPLPPPTNSPVRQERQMAGALLKGAILGLVLFALGVGGWLSRGFWLAEWHWAMLAMGLVIGSALIGFDRVLAVLAVAGLVWERSFIINQPLVLVGFVAGGSVLRVLWELVP